MKLRQQSSPSRKIGLTDKVFTSCSSHLDKGSSPWEYFLPGQIGFCSKQIPKSQSPKTIEVYFSLTQRGGCPPSSESEILHLPILWHCHPNTELPGHKEKGRGEWSWKKTPSVCFSFALIRPPQSQLFWHHTRRFSTSRNSATPAGVLQSSSDTIYLQLASDPIVKSSVPTRLPPLQRLITGHRLSLDYLQFLSHLAANQRFPWPLSLDLIIWWVERLTELRASLS